MYGKADNTTIKKELTDFKEQYLEEANEKPVNENWEQFKKKLAPIIDKSVPKKTVGKKRHNQENQENDEAKKKRV